MTLEIHVHFLRYRLGILDDNIVIWWSESIAGEAIAAAVNIDATRITTSTLITREMCA
jgi:hypothetical protein